jgi:signal transduction histidine kinase
VPSQQKYFAIHPSVVFQLGESLVSDVVQALVELVKNAYDADATYCKVTIRTNQPPPEGSAYPNASGYIVIEDDGTGMDSRAITDGWLTISNSAKRALKAEKKTTERGRTPLGDKGLGRLGTQRLGSNLEIFTRTAQDNKQRHIWFSWMDFRDKENLQDVPIGEEIHASQVHRGTQLIISDLQDAATWQGEAVDDLQRSLSQMISPYADVREFTVHANVNGRKLELAEITESVRDTAQVRYDLQFDGSALTIQGRAKLSYFRPTNDTDLALFREIVDADDGKALREYLFGLKGSERFNILKPRTRQWFVEYSTMLDFSTMDKIENIDGKRANPGPFHGAIDSFSLGSQTEDYGGILDTLAEYKQLISALSGIRVYRDGFGIKVDQDWLNLGGQWTSAKSWYGLKPASTLGYIALTARDNAVLEETTDREGFKGTPYFNNFYELLRRFVGFSQDAQGFLRRGWNEFRKDHERQVANVSENAKPEDLARTIKQALSRAAQLREPLTSAASHLRHSAEAGKVVLARKHDDPKLKAFLNDIEENLSRAQEVNDQVQTYINELTNIEAMGTVLTNQIDTLREQLSQTHEVLSLGITAEALSHEIKNIADRLAVRNQEVAQYLKRKELRDSRLTGFVEYINTTIGSLRKELSHLAPSLRYVREKRELVNLDIFMSEIRGYYATRFEPHELQLLPLKKRSFSIYISKGKLVQIMDNLILNAEYWLREAQRENIIKQGVITIEIARPFVRVSDNGLGIDPTIESALFQPFVTTKGKGKGRGLGLFVVQQLLDAEGCTISLQQIRNNHGRRYIFDLDFTGALRESD